jgi:hypothetical protein
VTERFGSPHALVVYKSKKDECHEYERWRSEVTTLQNRLTCLRNDIMRRLLGNDYDLLTSTDHLLQKRAPDDQQPLQTVAGPAQNARALGVIAGVKRKANVVDLTEDASD